jgi:glycosyltransferase domain-containing protein
MQSLALDEFTMVLITYNRYKYLLRLLKFYESYDFPFQILILDSSSDILDSSSLKELLKHEKINHIKFAPTVFVIEKLARGVDAISTLYSGLCADDDFIIPSAVSPCLDFLQKNLDYSCAQGINISHSLTLKGINWEPMYIWAHSVRYNKASKRLFSYLSGKAGGTQFYSVYRTELLQLVWKESEKYAIDHAFGELFPGSLSLIYGKRKILPVFYTSRESNNFDWSDDERKKEMYTSEKCEKAIEGLALHLQKVEGGEFKFAEKKARNAVMLHVRKTTVKTKKVKLLLLSKIISESKRVKNYIKRKSYYFRYLQLFERKNSLFNSEIVRIEESVFSAKIGIEEINKSRKDYSQQGKMESKVSS